MTLIGTQDRRRGDRRRDSPREHARRWAGEIFAATGMGTLMAIITGEALYPRTFTTAANTISDLGGTRPPNSVVYEPSRTIFLLTTLLAGLFVLAGDGRRWFIPAAAVGGGTHILLGGPKYADYEIEPGRPFAEVAAP